MSSVSFFRVSVCSSGISIKAERSECNLQFFACDCSFVSPTGCVNCICTNYIFNLVYNFCRLMVVPKPWKRTFFTNLALMEQDLFVTNPTMAGVLDLWYKSYGYVATISLICFGTVPPL